MQAVNNMGWKLGREGSFNEVSLFTPAAQAQYILLYSGWEWP